VAGLAAVLEEEQLKALDEPDEDLLARVSKLSDEEIERELARLQGLGEG
jgi:hypothetical protein